MAICPADMNECKPKSKCLFGPNEGKAYNPKDPCCGQGVFNASICDCIDVGVWVATINTVGRANVSGVIYIAYEILEPYINEDGDVVTTQVTQYRDPEPLNPDVAIENVVPIGAGTGPLCSFDGLTCAYWPTVVDRTVSVKASVCDQNPVYYGGTGSGAVSLRRVYNGTRLGQFGYSMGPQTILADCAGNNPATQTFSFSFIGPGQISDYYDVVVNAFWRTAVLDDPTPDYPGP